MSNQNNDGRFIKGLSDLTDPPSLFVKPEFDTHIRVGGVYKAVYRPISVGWDKKHGNIPLTPELLYVTLETMLVFSGMPDIARATVEFSNSFHYIKNMIEQFDSIAIKNPLRSMLIDVGTKMNANRIQNKLDAINWDDVRSSFHVNEKPLRDMFQNASQRKESYPSVLFEMAENYIRDFKQEPEQKEDEFDKTVHQICTRAIMNNVVHYGNDSVNHFIKWDPMFDFFNTPTPETSNRIGYTVYTPEITAEFHHTPGCMVKARTADKTKHCFIINNGFGLNQQLCYVGCTTDSAGKLLAVSVVDVSDEKIISMHLYETSSLAPDCPDGGHAAMLQMLTRYIGGVDEDPIKKHNFALRVVLRKNDQLKTPDNVAIRSVVNYPPAYTQLTERTTSKVGKTIWEALLANTTYFNSVWTEHQFIPAKRMKDLSRVCSYITFREVAHLSVPLGELVEGPHSLNEFIQNPGFMLVCKIEETDTTAHVCLLINENVDVMNQMTDMNIINCKFDSSGNIHTLNEIKINNGRIVSVTDCDNGFDQQGRFALLQKLIGDYTQTEEWLNHNYVIRQKECLPNNLVKRSLSTLSLINHGLERNASHFNDYPASHWVWSNPTLDQIVNICVDPITLLNHDFDPSFFKPAIAINPKADQYGFMTKSEIDKNDMDNQKVILTFSLSKTLIPHVVIVGVFLDRDEKPKHLKAVEVIDRTITEVANIPGSRVNRTLETLLGNPAATDPNERQNCFLRDSDPTNAIMSPLKMFCR